MATNFFFLFFLSFALAIPPPRVGLQITNKIHVPMKYIEQIERDVERDIENNLEVAEKLLETLPESDRDTLWLKSVQSEMEYFVKQIHTAVQELKPFLRGGSAQIVLSQPKSVSKPGDFGVCVEDANKFCGGISNALYSTDDLLSVAMCLSHNLAQLDVPCASLIGPTVLGQCARDIVKFCNDIKPGDHRVHHCLSNNVENLSESCVLFMQDHPDQFPKDPSDPLPEMSSDDLKHLNDIEPQPIIKDAKTHESVDLRHDEVAPTEFLQTPKPTTRQPQGNSSSSMFVSGIAGLALFVIIVAFVIISRRPANGDQSHHQIMMT